MGKIRDFEKDLERISKIALMKKVVFIQNISDVKRLNRLIQLTAKDINSKKYLQLSMDK